MALRKSTSSIWHLLSRLAGLTGLMAALVGLAVWKALGETFVGQIILISGGGVVALALLVELRGISRLVGSRRGAVGFNVLLQVALAIALLAGVNVFSFLQYTRFDWTHNKMFTIDPGIREQLAKLEDDTDIVVLLRHISFGQVNKGLHDNYDAAAERKIVDRVRDLVEMFRDLGPHFHVQVRDKQEQDFDLRLKEIEKKSKSLADAILNAPESSIFLFSKKAGGKVQRLGFHEIFQLDREASKEGAGNLVLRYQGLEPFARALLNIEARKPRIAVATFHPWLGLTNNSEDRYTMNGAKLTLESHGFVTTDILLKKFQLRGPPLPIAYTYEEDRFEALDDLRFSLVRRIPLIRKELEYCTKIEDDLKKKTLAEINKLYIHIKVMTPLGPQFRFVEMEDYDAIRKTGKKPITSDVDENDRKQEIKLFVDAAEELKLALEQMETELDNTKKEIKELRADELEEKQRIGDAYLKMSRVLADCDLLVIPRSTLIDVNDELRGTIPNELHGLHEDQLRAIRDFMKKGKPVLFCLGPTNDADTAPGAPVDPLEKTLDELGFKLPSQTILFDSEIKSFSQARNPIRRLPGSNDTIKVVIPPVAFAWKKGLRLAGKSKSASEWTDKATKDEPAGALELSKSLQIGNRSFPSGKELDLNPRHPRPVYYVKANVDLEGLTGLLGHLADPIGVYAAPWVWQELSAPRFLEKNAIIVTAPKAWNDDMPFPTRERPMPKYEPSKPSDSGFGTFAEHRRGVFPIMAAAQVNIPASWFPERGAKAKKVHTRLAVIGSGNIFTGKYPLKPMQQKLLIDTCNWLLGREDLLAKDKETWQYPRVAFSENTYTLWQLFAFPGVSLFFVYLGVVMWLVRGMR